MKDGLGFVSIIFWSVLGLLAFIASPKRSFPSLSAIVLVFYLAVKTESTEALWPIGVSFLLWLLTALISIRKHYFGITR